MAVDAFKRAQDLALERNNVLAEPQYIDVPVCRGQAQVLEIGEGPPVVMVNGIGTPAAMFAPLMAQLPGFTLYGVDLPGFGLTNAPVHFFKDIRTNAVQFLHEVIDALELDKPAIIANSLGSLWTCWFAMAKADRVSAIVHVGCPALLLSTSAPLPMRMLSVPIIHQIVMKLQPPSSNQVEQLSKMVREYPLQPEIAELLLATENLPDFAPAFQATLNQLVRPWGAISEMSLSSDQIAQIRQPTLFIWGDEDPMGSVEIGQQAVDVMPNAEMLVVDGGHGPWLRSSTEAGQAATEFLNQHCG